MSRRRACCAERGCRLGRAWRFSTEAWRRRLQAAGPAAGPAARAAGMALTSTAASGTARTCPRYGCQRNGTHVSQVPPPRPSSAKGAGAARCVLRRQAKDAAAHVPQRARRRGGWRGQTGTLPSAGAREDDGELAQGRSTRAGTIGRTPSGGPPLAARTTRGVLLEGGPTQTEGRTDADRETDRCRPRDGQTQTERRTDTDRETDRRRQRRTDTDRETDRHRQRDGSTQTEADGDPACGQGTPFQAPTTCSTRRDESGRRAGGP
jgi:hypothetical protein